MLYTYEWQNVNEYDVLKYVLEIATAGNFLSNEEIDESMTLVMGNQWKSLMESL